ncbi:uncharacterized protein LOC122039853 isoform X2 [Zingiber officinale]|uniref:uncharacterized protein LOC122039853 isoform X2 n=1 Tax=Zingiber officinale TaxID=94328 RepID=UPI001C4D00CC|nr:uncharacterized protein LOC122039853 isoform X2 [Zingiber officinale]
MSVPECRLSEQCHVNLHCHPFACREPLKLPMPRATRAPPECRRRSISPPPSSPRIHSHHLILYPSPRVKLISSGFPSQHEIGSVIKVFDCEITEEQHMKGIGFGNQQLHLAPTVILGSEPFSGCELTVRSSIRDFDPR